MTSERKRMATRWNPMTDEEVAAELSEARNLEATAPTPVNRAVYRKRRLASERELRRRQKSSADD